MAEKKAKTAPTPPVIWLKMTDYMHGWMEYELSGTVRVGEQKLICVQHLPGARDILRMETWDDAMDDMPLGNALSCTRQICYSNGLIINKKVMKERYGVTQELMDQFVPIEAPMVRLTRGGVLRAWNIDSCPSHAQASALQHLLRQAFWDAVAEFDSKYAEEQGGEHYPAKEMVEAFCAETGTSDIHVDAIRREWQRRCKREEIRCKRYDV